MNKHKKNHRIILHRPTVAVWALIVAAVALTLSVILSLNALYERHMLDLLYKQEFYHTVDNKYWTTRVTFCYDNNIRPCDYDTINKWNDAHPDNTYNTVPPDQFSDPFSI